MTGNDAARSSTIVAFGDSTTAPRTVDGQALTVYADLLRLELPLQGITGSVHNKGVGGNTTDNATARFNTDVLTLNPDLTIIQFGINDSAIDVYLSPPATETRVPLAKYVANMTSMVRTLRGRGSQVILMTPNPMCWTPELIGYYGKPPYDANDPDGFNLNLKIYAQSVRDLAASEQVALVDIYTLFSNYALSDLLLDGMHPNAAGHRMIAGALKSVILPMCLSASSIKKLGYSYRSE